MIKILWIILINIHPYTALSSRSMRKFNWLECLPSDAQLLDIQAAVYRLLGLTDAPGLLRPTCKLRATWRRIWHPYFSVFGQRQKLAILTNVLIYTDLPCSSYSSSPISGWVSSFASTWGVALRQFVERDFRYFLFLKSMYKIPSCRGYSINNISWK